MRRVAHALLPCRLTMQRLARQQGYSLVDVLIVAGLISVVSAMAVPMIGTAVSGQRIQDEAQTLNSLVGQAKMRASSMFTWARVRVNTLDGTYALERWDKTANAWVMEGGLNRLSQQSRFGFGTLATPPPNTQAAIGQSAACRVGVVVGSGPIGNTACILFNSRGLPIDGDGNLFGGHALYLTDGRAVYGTTVTATPRIRLWWTPAPAANWSEQQ